MLEWLTKRKILATFIGVGLISSGIIIDALAWTGSGLRFVCSLVSEDNRSRLPCPAMKGPREELAHSMRIQWSEESFWNAVRRGDGRATELFLRGGMTIDGARLHAVLTEPLISKKAPLDILVKSAGEKSAEFCSSDDEDGRIKPGTAEHRTALRFVVYSANDATLSFVKRFCVDSGFREALARHEVTESQRLDSMVQRNKMKTISSERCYENLRKPDALRRVKAAASGTCAEDLIKSPNELQFCSWLLLGRDDGEFARVPEKAIAHFCAPDNDIIDADRRDGLRKAIQSFGG